MAIITFPDTLGVESAPWGQQRNDISFRSAFGAQGVEIALPLWVATLQAPPDLERRSGGWKVLGLQLRGQTNQLALWDLARPVPLGTMRGSMTLNASAAQGATTLSIVASGEAGKTLLKADYLGLGSGLTQQVIMVMSDATSDSSGVISVTVEPGLRNAFSAGAAVTWNKPKTLFRRVNSKFGWEYRAARAEGFSLDLIEDWRI
ncbi:hypothetical protein [Nitrosospira sp. Nsp1]|uniref:hypothetical protein n=1 Tax=Nitrosospira sp. Nsp1 TaxID=136547 RepID=UPI00088F0FD5|nr:hypothetical protein [Nitrosospira sp. Nsp1]SCX40471.1 hypothetical protein SAMN05720354_103115 [Nitrosospira sp. Nsp1]